MTSIHLAIFLPLGVVLSEAGVTWSLSICTGGFWASSSSGSVTFEGIPPGSTCIANAYTSNHDRLDSPDVGTIERFVLHGIDTVGIVHAIVLRIQALLLPVQTLVLSGGH